MCNVINNNYFIDNSFLYENDEVFFKKIDEINNLEQIENNLGIVSKITSFIASFIATNKVPLLSPSIISATYTQLNNYNVVTDYDSVIANKNIQNNLYNFSLAKNFHFLKNLQRIMKSGEDVVNRTNKLTNLVFSSQLTTEVKQVKHTTKTVKTISKNNYSNKKILKFVTYNDDKVRTEHAKANNTTLPASDKRWNQLSNLLGEWGCRCEIIEVFEETNKIIQQPPSNIKYAKTTEASEIDIETGKVEIFSQSLPVFKNTEIIRKYYRK